MVPLVAVTSLRRKLSVSAAVGLLLVPGCHAVEQELPYAEPVRSSPDDLAGMEASTVSVTTDDSAVSYRYPRLGGGHPLTVEARTAMAARQTAFLEDLPEGGSPELHQDTAILAASPEVVGARLTATASAGGDETFEADTLWYDADSGEVLPWTSLFRDEEAIEQAHLALAEVLEEGYNLPERQLPGLVGEVASGERSAPEGGASAEGRGGTTNGGAAGGSNGEADGEPGGGEADGGSEPLDLSEPDQAREAAERWAGSPLGDLAFSTAGGLAVRMDPDAVPSAGRVGEVLVPVEAADVEGLLSELGYLAREAALDGDGLGDDLSQDEGGLSAQGHTLDCDRLKCVALTFDDGPGEHTDRLLDGLAEYDAHATFYVLGSLVDEFPAPVERMAEEGHELGNHTWKHDDLAQMSADEIRKDIERTNAAVREVTGVEPPTIRPPYGSLNGTVRKTVEQPLVLWDVDTLDWKSRDTDEVSAAALGNTVPGSVVLFHDIHETSVEAIPDVLEGLHRRGYHFVTVTDIFGYRGMESGDVYTDARLS
ncbi:polysaccharide deacetylase family protein [Nocardiopsis sp. HUAS JQ3]|uniref:polysaccharide deacetylase family protein n=1 Tax=Nocardiopsis sp. HUAS JQ3 TaxID=3061629 RepID=UPI0023AA11FC|nr:polysaccharide deacetylase family protein [Nocardiopsis sp. HUAS JQ3]WDZ93613.1 polysaccharide deacetylase family protein [Nocardiopsis sp. HUAS JQ3]